MIRSRTKKKKGISEKNLQNLNPFIKKFWKKGILGAVIIFVTVALGFPTPLINRFLIDERYSREADEVPSDHRSYNRGVGAFSQVPFCISELLVQPVRTGSYS